MTKKDKYIYPAVFTYDQDGISIEFPDLPGCLPCANTPEEAFKNAKEAMALHLYSTEQDHEPIPDPTPALYVLLRGTTTILTQGDDERVGAGLGGRQAFGEAGAGGAGPTSDPFASESERTGERNRTASEGWFASKIVNVLMEATGTHVSATTRKPWHQLDLY